MMIKMQIAGAYVLTEDSSVIKIQRNIPTVPVLMMVMMMTMMLMMVMMMLM